MRRFKGQPNRSSLAQQASSSLVELQQRIERLIGSQPVLWQRVTKLTSHPKNPRKHPRQQIRSLARSITKHGWTNPIVVDECGLVLIGNGRLEAAKTLKLARVPTLTISCLSDAEKLEIVIADNRVGEGAEWDLDILAEDFKYLCAPGCEIGYTGFSDAEIDFTLDRGKDPGAAPDPHDDFELSDDLPAVSQPGDLWEAGDHRLYCGDARNGESYGVLLGHDRVQMILADPPYNVAVNGHARGRGQKFREFVMASGEMTDLQYETFLVSCMKHCITYSLDGSVHYWCADWRHLPSFFQAGLPLYGELKQLLVWDKGRGGMGSFYRSQHEMIPVFKNGNAPHINNFGLGAEGRNRTNIITYPGGASSAGARHAEMNLHPTVKPTGLFAGLIKDCSKRNGLILDPFCGSGTILLAAERTGRKARAIELDPLYVDLAIRRWQEMVGGVARRSCDGRAFSELEQANEHAREQGSHPRRQR